MKELHEMVDECYQEFISDESIVGFNGLLKSKGLGSKRIIKLRNLIYEKYGKEELVKIYRKRLAYLGGKSSLGHVVSDQTKLKISLSNKKSWGQDDGKRKELSKKLMIEKCNPLSRSDETTEKRINSRRKGKGWHNHSIETKKKISKIFFDKWKNGDYENRVKSFSSKSQKEIEELIRSLGYSVEGEYFVNGRPYDIFVKEKNLIIEYNGTYWHFDPKIYDKNHFDKGSGMYAYEVWERDRIKLDNVKSLGYNVVVIWENEWQRCQNKKDFIKKLLC